MSTTSGAEQLVSTLIDQTASGRISWEPADALATTFITKSTSGTVAVEGGFDGLTASPSLVARDRYGNVIERISPFQGAAIGRPDLARAAAGIRELYELILRQRAQADSKLKKLAEEFAR